MSGRHALLVLAAALTAVISAFLQAVAIEGAIERLAAYLEIPRLAMIAAAFPHVIVFVTAAILISAAYQLGVRDRRRRMAAIVNNNGIAADNK
jgi:hypothetical protein